MWNSFDDLAIKEGKCEICNQEGKLAVIASRFGYLRATCKKCFEAGLDSYDEVIARIYCLPPVEIRVWATKNEDYLKKYHNKSKEDFIKDCEKANAEFNKWASAITESTDKHKDMLLNPISNEAADS